MTDGWRPSSITRSTASAPVNSTLARVVSKCVLEGIALPGPATTPNRILSAARPWWAGITCLNGKRVWTLSSLFQAEDGIRDDLVTGVQTCALPIYPTYRLLAQITDEDDVGHG